MFCVPGDARFAHRELKRDVDFWVEGVGSGVLVLIDAGLKEVDFARRFWFPRFAQGMERLRKSG